MFFDTLNGWMSDWATDEAPWAGGTDFTFDPTQIPANAVDPILSHPYETAGQVDPFPSQIPPPSNVNFANAGFTPGLGAGNNFVNIHIKTPYIYQYNLSIQRQLANGLMAEIGYAGSSSHKLLTWVDQDPMILGTSTRVLNQQLLASNPNADPNTFGFAPTFDGLNHANYDGLLTSLTKRAEDVHFIGNVFFTTAYTWSHNLDNGTGFNSRVSSIPYYNHNQFYGNSDFDLRQRFTFSGGWELPFAKTWATGPKRTDLRLEFVPHLLHSIRNPAGLSCRYTPAFHGPWSIRSGGWRDREGGPNGQFRANVQSTQSANVQRNHRKLLVRSQFIPT